MSFLPAGESDKNRQIKRQNLLNFSHIIFFDFALLYPPFCSAFFFFPTTLAKANLWFLFAK